MLNWHQIAYQNLCHCECNEEGETGTIQYHMYTEYLKLIVLGHEKHILY